MLKPSFNTTLNYSPNFDVKRRKLSQIKFIIFHYTGMQKEKDAINRLTDIKAKVSSHYLIKNNGEIITLVPDVYVSWHAGISFWKNYSFINKYSIGIEISNPGHSHEYKKFSKKQINSILKLSKFLIKKYKINSKFILGHSDIAPYRKKDPGNKFPWKKLYKKNLSYDPKKVKLSNIKKIRLWFKKYRIYSNKNKILIMLNIIGYDISKSTNSKYFYKILLNNYTNHYFQKISNKNTNITLIDFIELHLYSLLLTKT